MRKDVRENIELYIKDNYLFKTAKEISRIVGTKHKAIHEIARKSKIKKTPNWSNFEVNILKTFGAEKSSEILNRSLASCRTKKSRWKSTSYINK